MELDFYENKWFKEINKKIYSYFFGFKWNQLLNLITNYHVITKERINDEIVIEIHNHKTMKLKKENREIKYFERPKDITIIEIKNNDNIYNYIDFLDYDYNCVPNRYNIYKDIDVFSIEIPWGDNASCGSGTIININNFEFEHTISTDNGSYGCPIILLNNNINFIQVIGIHKNANTNKKINYGTFIGEIFNKNYFNKKINKETGNKSGVVNLAVPEEIPNKIDNDIENRPDYNKILIKFKTTNGVWTDVYIDPEKRIKDLIKKYFEKIKQPKLFKDKDILFLSAGNKIDKNSTKKISEFIQKYFITVVPIFTILDPKNKVQIQ